MLVGGLGSKSSQLKAPQEHYYKRCVCVCVRVICVALQCAHRSAVRGDALGCTAVEEHECSAAQWIIVVGKTLIFFPR